MRRGGFRPLDRVGTIKLKFGLVIVAAVVVTVVVVVAGSEAGLPLWAVAGGAMALALGLVQVLARGMTSPLRAMARQAKRLAAGEDHTPVVATSRDEVGDLARAFNHMAAEVRAADRMRRDLVANISHELRTPIAALQAVVENLEDGVEQPDATTLAAMSAQVARLSTLVDQLLDLSRLEAGSVPLDRRRVTVRELVDDAVTAATLTPDRTPVEVVVQPPELTVDVDPARLEQVVVNLLTNAARHSPGGAAVRVEAGRARGEVVLTVTDRGPGIAPADADRIFERFERSDQARATHDGGSGLGLAICRWIVDLHGGRIEVDTGYQEGSRMVVRLPDDGST